MTFSVFADGGVLLVGAVVSLPPLTFLVVVLFSDMMIDVLDAKFYSKKRCTRKQKRLRGLLLTPIDELSFSSPGRGFVENILNGLKEILNV